MKTNDTAATRTPIPIDFSPEEPMSALSATSRLEAEGRPPICDLGASEEAEAGAGEDEPDWTPSTPRTDREAWTPVILERGGTSGQAKKAKQREFSLLRIVERDEILLRLIPTGRSDLYEPLRACHTKETIMRCQGCGKVSRFWNRCDVMWCPICAPRLAFERRMSLDWWANQISQPKHVVVTIRNTDRLTRAQIRKFKSNLRKLRRRSIAKNWRGGCWRLEVTNESRGWHLHAHLLVDARWIDQIELARTWGEIVGQDFAIVQVKDVRGQSYLQEVAKYVVKAAEMMTWTGAELVEFMDALGNERTFGTFGTLYRKNAEWKAAMDDLHEALQTCECGCTDREFFSPDEYDWYCISHEPRGPTRPVLVEAPAETPSFPQIQHKK